MPKSVQLHLKSLIQDLQEPAGGHLHPASFYAPYSSSFDVLDGLLYGDM
jgi:hypothetical protein